MNEQKKSTRWKNEKEKEIERKADEKVNNNHNKRKEKEKKEKNLLYYNNTLNNEVESILIDVILKPQFSHA